LTAGGEKVDESVCFITEIADAVPPADSSDAAGRRSNVKNSPSHSLVVEMDKALCDFPLATTFTIRTTDHQVSHVAHFSTI
jgi:hypothetical protein